jgi:DNA mismatch endonuclease Vsr
MDRLTKEQRRKNMQAVKNKGSKIESIIGKGLWTKGLRYRKNDRTIFGKPDFVFKKNKVAIFCDSEFWHGKDWNKRKNEHKSNIDFWHQKISRNIQRDKEVNRKLRMDGWLVLRFWGKDIEKNSLLCIHKIEQAVQCRRKELKQ